MALAIGDVLGILADNLILRKSVLPLSHSKVTGWADGLDIPVGGGTVIYTGHMYQLMPAIMAMEKQLSRFEDSWLSHFTGAGRVVNKAVNASWFMARASRKDQDQFNKLLRNIVRLLRVADVKFGYLYGEELYTGALIHDQGVCEVFEEHVHKVYDVFKRHGVARVITFDPHTTDMLRTVYPKIIEGYHLEVKSYLEVLSERDIKPVKKLDLDFVIHDSCVYARYEGIVEEPRRLLQRAGARVIEPEYSGKMTFCCGGPVESLFPSKAHQVAENRLDQLSKAGNNITTMCPICLINLMGAVGDRNVTVKDISEYLVQAYCGV
jgi:Fe-S oxidoreductase